MNLDSIVNWISGEWSVVSQAPIIFVASVILVGLIIWKLSQREFSTRLTNAESTLSLRNAQLLDYKEKLSGATPDQAKARMDALEERLNELGPRIAALGPRKLSAEQKHQMLPILEFHRGSLVSICSDAASADAASYSKGLAKAFNAAAWNVQPSMAMGIGDPPPSGMGLLVNDPSNLTVQQQSIASALEAAGLEFDIRPGMHVATLSNDPKQVAVAELLLTTSHED
jgi:hypothetical protein